MEAYQSRLESAVRTAASADTEIAILRLENAVVAGKGFASAQALEVPRLLRSIRQAVSAGFESIAIGNGFDPGLWEARELFDIPILGLFETVSVYALRAGWRFGVLCSGRSGITRVEELATRYGIASRMVRPAAVGVTVPDVVAAFSDPSAAQQINETVRSATDELGARGAEVVVIASGALDVFIGSQQSSASARLPILPSTTILVRELETSALLARLGVPYISRAGRFAKPPSEVVSTLGAISDD